MSKVLIVDDERIIRFTLGEMLKAEGYDVELAETAEEAFELLQNKSFDIVISDIVLPRINGLELLTNIRVISPNTQVILITGEPGLDSATEAVRAGAFDYIIKPVTKDAICRSVSRADSVKQLKDENLRLAELNKRYQQHLEELVDQRTRALSISETRFRLLFESVSDVVYTIDLDGNLTSISPSALRIIGYAPEELIDKKIRYLGIIAAEDYERAEADQQKVIAGEIIEATYVFQTRDGARKFVEVSGAPLHSGDDIIASVFTARDVSERKKVEAALKRANEELIEFDQLRTNFLSNVSHELRTPLVCVKGYSELMLKNRPGEATIQNWLEKVLVNCSRLETIIDGLLEISNLQAGALKLTCEKCCPKEIVAGIKVGIGQQLTGKSIELVVDIDDHCPDFAADQQKVLTVLFSLLDNAIKFSPQNGKIELKIFKSAPNMIQFSIRDYGIGIEDRHFVKVFQRFYQVDSTSTRRYDGLGIGLALAREIVEAHDGAIWVESEPDHGSTFYFNLPLKGPGDMPGDHK